MNFRDSLRSMDWIILACALLLTAMGLAMFFSAVYTAGPVSPFFVRQSIAAVMGIVVCLFISRFPYHSLRRLAVPLYVIGIGMQLFVGVTGRIIRGTVSRLELFGFQLQPSEFMKIVLVITLAWLFSRAQRVTPRYFFISAIFLLVPFGLVLAEPDLGMAVLLLTVWAGMLVFLGLPGKAIAGLILVGLLIFGAGWQWVFLDYQKARITSFLHPTSDRLGAGYNVTQSIVALGSGGLFGRGLGHGPQSQLKFLPERHTDFILASIGEELGFVGVLVVVMLYVVMVLRIVGIARLTNDPFGQLLCVGACLLFIISLGVSAGMNMGLLPVTGIPLSFVSYGGSNLLASFVLLGIVESVRIHSRFAQRAPIEISHIV